MKIERLKREPEKVADKLGFIENQIKSVMGYEDSGDQLAKLEYSKARIEKELKQKQEDIDQLPKDDCNNFVLCLRLLINSLSYLMGISVGSDVNSGHQSIHAANNLL